MASDYYREKLASEKLRQVYGIAPPRVKQYLDAEINYIMKHIHANDSILELGCGYGRVLERVLSSPAWITGIDTSIASLLTAREVLMATQNVALAQMDAVNLGFADNSFDVVIGIQNGISAFHVDQRELIKESIRVTKPGGMILFSSYSCKFWSDRLEWFRLQSEAGLLGEIDYDKTHDGVIVCKDGFTATTVEPEQFLDLVAGFDISATIEEIDESSIFCKIEKYR
jgi:ubiquinone/menaquinone biosynthesis C-methylase UbiE